MDQTISGPARPKTQVKVTVLLEFNEQVDPATVGEIVRSTLDTEYYGGVDTVYPSTLVELVSAELQPCPTENT